MPTRYNGRYVIHIDETVQRKRMNSPRKFAQPLLPFLRDGDGVTAFEACGLRVDFSRQRLTQDDLARLVDFANGLGLMEAHHAMVQGEIVNKSENRAALHTSLRSQDPASPHFDEVKEARDRAYAFAESVRSGKWTGCRGDTITDVINIGIGGSEVGPRAVYHALMGLPQPIKVHFLSGVDGVQLDRILYGLDPFRTLVVVSSKSFHTRETLVNASVVDEWLAAAGITGSSRDHHVIAVSANPDAYKDLRIPEENLYPLWDWVGGRFSVWGCIGIPDMIALGTDVFDQFLSGAYEMDRYVYDAPVAENISALLALIAFWNATRLNITLQCVLPYDERLRIFVSWEQQLEMESLGKTTQADGTVIVGNTGQAVWGGHGDESQHSFYQWLREGTGRTSIDLISCEKPGHSHEELHRVMIANARAQAQALVTRDPSMPWFNGVTTISISDLTPKTLGALMAMYEHKITMLGTLFGLNPFDQPGVEFGKKLSREAENRLREDA
ncbi:glucose-6-phosphate isomerase [Sutterella sp. CAG:351]|nr:glucose-6-phosphate isomerase [Sutterella sp. CAG:351]